jgi:hypothetical protein
MSIKKFTIEKIYEKKKNIISSDDINCFCIASNFILPYEISFREDGLMLVDILFDKILASNNFYVALDDPITPQIYGNYSILWSFRYEVISSKSDKVTFKAIIRTSCMVKEFDFFKNSGVNHNLFNLVIPCKGFAAGDGILFEISSSESSTINISTNKVDIKYESPFE